MNVRQIETALSSTHPTDITVALDALYGQTRTKAKESSVVRTRWNVIVAAGLLLVVCMGLWNRAAASGERVRLQERMSIVPDFFAAVEDGGNRTEALAVSLVSLPSPEYSGNLLLWKKGMLEVNALLAVQSAKGGRWELSKVYEQRARDFLGELSEPDLLSRCIVEYAECRRRHEQALSGGTRDRVQLANNVQQLTVFLESCSEPYSSLEKLAIGRLYALAGISGYKGGTGDWPKFFDLATRHLQAIPDSRRDSSWLFAYSRLAADRSMHYVGRDQFDESRRILDDAIDQLAGVDEPYLNGLLHGNRADVSLVERSVVGGDLQAIVETEITDRRIAIEELARPLSDGSSLNQLENETLHRSRLIMSLANAGRMKEAHAALRNLEQVETVNDPISFWNPQVGPLERAAVALTLATDSDRPIARRNTAFDRAINIINGLVNKKGAYPLYARRLAPFTGQLRDDQKQMLSAALDRFNPRSE